MKLSPLSLPPFVFVSGIPSGKPRVLTTHPTVCDHRPRKRGCTGLDTASSSKAEEEELLLPGVTTIELPCLMEPYAQPAELAKATTKDWAEVNWEEVEYELDAEDDRWLEENRESGLDASQLEFLIDRLEKMKSACADGAEVSVEQIASLVSDVIQPEAVVAAAGWWQEKSAGREESLLRRLQPPTDFDNLDSARVFRPGRRQRSIRERKESVNYREMSTGEINRLARQESAEQRKARIEAEKARREQIRERKRLLEEQEIAEAERLEEEGRKRKRDEERAIAAARKEQQIAERVGSVLERIVRTIVRDDRDRRRLEKAERERIAAELRRQKQMAIQKRRDDAEIAKVFQSIVVELEAEATRNAKLNAREQARLRREQASAKLAELASSRLKDNSVSKGVRQARGPVRAIAYDPVDAAVVAACVDNSLWRGRLNPTAATEATAGGWETVAVEWTQIGTALNVVSQAVLGDHLFACDRSNTIWRRSMRVEPSAVVWEHWGKLGTKQNGVMALTASTGHLYAATNAGKLMRTDASAPGGKWSEVGLADKVRAMASAPGQDAPVQFALSADGSFWRRSGEAVTWRLLGTPDTKLVVANGIAATESVVVGSDSTSILCCSWATCGEGGGDDKAAERKPSHWWRSLPLPPVVVGKKPGVPGAGPGRKPGRRKKVVQQPVQPAGTVAGQQSAVPAAASSAPAAKAGAMPDSAAAAATASA